jgi:hypothetical protein
MYKGIRASKKKEKTKRRETKLQKQDRKSEVPKKKDDPEREKQSCPTEKGGKGAIEDGRPHV